MEQVIHQPIVVDKNKVNKNMILFLAGKLVSLFGSSIYGFAMSLYILQVTGSGLSFSMTLVLSNLPRVILGPIAGAVADRFDRKKIVVGLDILSGLIVLGLWMVSLYDELRVIYIYIASFSLATCSTFFSTALSASIPNIVDRDSLTRINSLNSAIGSLAGIVGPAIGGLVFALIDIRLFLLINGLSYVFSGISEQFIDFKVNGDKISEKDSKKSDAKSSIISDIKEGLVYIIKEKWLIVLCSFIVFFNVFVMIGMMIPVPYIVNTIWGFSSQQYGIVSMAFPVGMLLSSLVLSILPEAKSNYKRMMGSILGFSLGTVLLGVVLSRALGDFNNWIYVGLLTLLYFGQSIASALINIPMMVTLQKKVPDENRGRVNGTLETFSMGLYPVGAIVGGILIDIVTPWYLPLACGIIMVILTLFMYQMKELKDI